jgi:hypothetical protein
MKIEQVLTVIDRGAAWAWIRQLHFPAGLICPGCGNVIAGQRALASFERLERTYCRTCGVSSAARAFIPVLRSTEWQPEEFVKFLILNLTGQHPAYIGKLLGKSTTCVREMIDKVALLAPELPGEVSPTA